MKTKQFIIVCVAILLVATSCLMNDYPNNNVIRAFNEYVIKDFDEPKSFDTITRIDNKDTVSTESLLKLLKDMEKDSIFLPESIKRRRYALEKYVSQSDIFIVQHEVKVRLKDKDGNRKLKTFYVVENKGNFSVRENELTMDEMPLECRKVYELFSDATKSLKTLY